MAVVSTSGKVATISFDGRIDAYAAPDMEKEIRSLIRKGMHRLVVDLRGVTFLSSAGLRVLLTALKDTRKVGGDLRIAAMPPRVKETFELTGFTSIFKIYGTTEVAVLSFGE